MTGNRPRVAFFRPNDERVDRATAVLTDLGAEPVPDPMLAIEPTGSAPRSDADYLVLTSKTGVELVSDTTSEFTELTTCAIGDATAEAMAEAGVHVDVVPDTYTSRGLVERLRAEVDGKRVEIARSDHGSPELVDGLFDAGAYVHETVLYELTRPADSGHSTEQLVAGDIDVVLFTSSLTVQHFLEAAAERGIRANALRVLDDVVVGAIGPPTADTAASHRIPVDIVASEASFDVLAREALGSLAADRPA